MLKQLVFLIASLLWLVASSPARADDLNAPPDPVAEPSPKWIWGGDAARDGEERYFRITFDPQVPQTPKTEDPHSAWLWAACDDEMVIHLNGKQVVRHSGHSNAVLDDVRSLLVPGENVLSIRCRNNTGPAGLALKLEIRRQYGEPFRLVTDQTWMTASKAPRGWRNRDFANASFTKARIVGPYGIEPWGKLDAPLPARATSVQNLTLLPGFKAELVYSVPKHAQGSWVSMTPDPRGRLYVCDQSGPLFRVTPGADGKPTQVEPVDLEIGNAQGLLWAFDSLYVVVNGGRAPYESGLYRLRDTDGDDKLDQVTTLKQFSNRERNGQAGGEHGPHAVILSPDKRSLYIVAGNFTELPDGIAPTSPAQHWSEDLLLERMTDGRGHDPTIYAPGSWVCRTDPEGKTWEAIAVGMRNAYDIAFSPEGELFTYDSDMEWDIGTPWWRPIRICHVVSGAEFGWRNGSAKWPTYYPDSVPPVVETGIGSPTGVTFGTGAKFPEKYQRALFAADWAYGKLYAVHLKPDGAGYQAEYEPFIIGKPFDITDVVINTDGAMYITIGGRGTQSGLYRITYAGGESTTAAAPIADGKSAEARALRHKLESFHGRRDPQAIDAAWPYLKSDDRFLRYAARVAIESQDPALWVDRALSAKQPVELISAIIALCRVGNASLQPRVLEALNRIDLKTLADEQLLEALRAYQLCFIRLGRPADPAAGPEAAARLNALFPHQNSSVNRELCQLLVYLEWKPAIEKSMKLLAAATTQEEQLFYAFNLRNVRDGWTLPLREAYFNWLGRAQQNYTGGASFKQFLQKMRDDAVGSLGDDEKLALAALIKPPVDLATEADRNLPNRKFVKNWQMADLTPRLDRLKSGRSFERGKAALTAVSCLKCHLFNGQGGGTGPDISGVGNRFQPVDLLEAIILPSKIISDQYQATQIITKKKEVVVGTVQEENDQQVVVRSSPLSTHTETVAKNDIAQRGPSKLSIMPQGLIDVLSEDEILDLIAYLRSGGNPNDAAFQKPAASAQ